MATLRTATTSLLDVAYLESGDPGGVPVVLLHGFPYDVRSYDDVAELLAADGLRVIVPWLRGFGSTRFRDPDTMRSGQQAAVGRDLLDLLDALGIERAVVGGYDWGGRAACVLAALHPERVRGLVSMDGYTIQDVATGADPGTAADERERWYVHFFQTESGRRALEQDREDICSLLWRVWSPTWADVASAFLRSAPSLHNPDFVDVAIHSYRHRRGAAPGDPRYEADEAVLAGAPEITVPTVAIVPEGDGIPAADAETTRSHFTGGFEVVRMPGVGHDPPQEAPVSFAAVVQGLVARTR